MPVDLPVLKGKVPSEADVAFQRLKRHANNLEQDITTLQAKVSAIPAPLTLEQIRAGLSATGAAPLNLTGLVGTPAAVAALPPAPPSGIPGVSPSPGRGDGGAGETGCGLAGVNGHVDPALPIDPTTAGMIVCGTGNEFPNLLAVVVDQPTRDANRLELLNRMIWHLALHNIPSSLYPGNPFDLLLQIGPDEYAYRVTDYATFDTPMATTMVPGGITPNTTVQPQPGTPD